MTFILRFFQALFWSLLKLILFLPITVVLIIASFIQLSDEELGQDIMDWATRIMTWGDRA